MPRISREVFLIVIFKRLLFLVLKNDTHIFKKMNAHRAIVEINHKNCGVVIVLKNNIKCVYVYMHI